MISERDIAEKFSVIWKQHFPLLTSNFMRVFNESRILDANIRDIPMIENVRYDLISELAFNVADYVKREYSNVDDVMSNVEILNQLILSSVKGIWKKSIYSTEDLTLNEYEIEETRLICINLYEFIDQQTQEDSYFKPKLKGYGFLSDLEADISIDDTLYEIKTVNRNFKSSDLKQLFIYLALQQVTGENKWKYAGLYNPRKGVYCKFNVKKMIYDLSGGKSSIEVFTNFLESLNRDLQLDSKF